MTVREGVSPGFREVPVHILRKSWQFRHVYTHGKRVSAESLLLFYLRNDAVEGVRFGFVASRRIGKAVKRNRAKRLLREAARSVLSELAPGDIWIVLVARTPILEAGSNAVAALLRGLLRQEGLLRN